MTIGRRRTPPHPPARPPPRQAYVSSSSSSPPSSPLAPGATHAPNAFLATDSTDAKPDEQTVATARQFVQTVAVPRLAITIERENGRVGARALLFDGDLCRIGTHSTNDVVLQDPAVSRFHCRLVRDEGGWRVHDWDSLNGVEVEGLRVRDADLPSEATIVLGDSVVRVHTVDPAEQAVVPMIPAFGQLAGTSVRMRKLFAVLQKVAPSDINVLIQGESGTGKELVANEIVQRSPRGDKPFVVVDCGAISPYLVESELFGHLAAASRVPIGTESAHSRRRTGQVFLDEVAELPVELQPKLIRAIEAREVRRVGETRPRKVNVRVLSATNRQLEREVNRGRFREDLYFRLAVMTVRVPPLRERLDDLLILVRVFLQSWGVPDEERLFTAAVLAEMARHDWPGNVRELRNYVERSVVLQKASPALRSTSLAPGSGLPLIDIGTPFRVAKDEAVDAFERAYLSALLEAAGNNMSKAARLGGMDWMYLHRLAQKHGLRGGGAAGASS